MNYNISERDDLYQKGPVQKHDSGRWFPSNRCVQPRQICDLATLSHSA